MGSGKPGEPIGVGYFVESLGPGGTEAQIAELVRHLDRDRFSPFIFAWDPRDFFGPAIARSRTPLQRRRRRGRLDPTPALVAARWLRSRRIQIAHGFLDPGSFYAALGRHLSRRGKVVVSHRTGWVEHRRLGMLHKRWSHRSADVVVTNSFAAVSRVRQLVNGATRVCAIPNGVDLERFRSVSSTERMRLRELLGWPPDGLVVLVVGRLCEDKNQLGIVHALSQLKPLDDVLIMFLGDASGKYASTVGELVSRLGLGPNLRLCEPRVDIEVAYQACDAVVLGSLVEGTPNAVLEAMACERPVLATDVGDVRRYVLDGETGWLVPPRDGGALRAGLATVLSSHPDGRARLGAAGRRRLNELEVDVVSMVRQFEELYEALVREDG